MRTATIPWGAASAVAMGVVLGCDQPARSPAEVSPVQRFAPSPETSRVADDPAVGPSAAERVRAILDADPAAPRPTPAAMTAVEPEPAPDGAAPGSSKANAIEVCTAAGERKYLARLRCANGKPPVFRRAGNVGNRNDASSAAARPASMKQMLRKLKPGETDLHIVDRYEVACGKVAVSIFLDMYHCGAKPPAVAPPGFTLSKK